MQWGKGSNFYVLNVGKLKSRKILHYLCGVLSMTRTNEKNKGKSGIKKP